MRINENHDPAYRTPAATLSVVPTRDDFNFYGVRKSQQQIEEEVADLLVGLGYSFVVFAIVLALGAIFKSAVG